MSKELKSSIYFYQDTLNPPKKSSDTLQPIIDSISKITTRNSKTNLTPINSNKPANAVYSNKWSNREFELIKIDVSDKTLINSYKSYVIYNSNSDSTCYIPNKQNDNINGSSLFIEKIPNRQKIESDYVIVERTTRNVDWIIIPVILGLFLIVTIVVRYSKYLGLLLESIIYRFSNSKIINEKNVQFQRLTLFLDILFVISFALTTDQIIKALNFYTPPEKFQYIVFVAICAFIIALRLFRLVVFKLSAIFSNSKTFFTDLFRNAALYTRVLGIFLFPMGFLIAYSTGLLNIFLIYFSIFITLILLILRIISIFRAFIVGGFSIFYFIVYLCALEIVPLLVIWKEVKSR